MPAQLGDLRGLVADNERQGPRIAELAGRVDAFLGWVADEDRLVRAGDRDRAMAGLDRGSQLLEAVRGTIDAVRGEEEGLDRQRMGRLRSSSARQVWTLVVGGAAIVVSTLILALLFLQGIIQRLAVLRENARRFAEGKPLNPPLAGRDEITEVDRAFHDMADNLGQQKQENEMFVYSVSHDLRSPLVNLQGFSEELSLSCRDLRELFRRDDVPEPVRRRGLQLMDRDIEESIRFIQTAVGRLARIIDALLRLSRAGRVEYQWQAVDLAATVGKIVDALHDTITAKGAEVVVGDLPPAWGDPTAVEQVFANLIGNAVKYLDPGRPGRIEVDGDEPDGHGLPSGPDRSTTSGTTAWASPRPITIACSPPSAAPRRTSPRARGSAWPWCGGWSSGTAGGSGWSRRRASAPRSSSPCPRPPATAPRSMPAATARP